MQATQQPVRTADRPVPAPSFYITRRQTLGPGAILLATAIAAAALCLVLYGLRHTAGSRVGRDGSGTQRSAGGGPQSAENDDKDDDPNQVDTIVLGDPGDAPAPARHGDHVSPVHATVVMHLPRFGEGTGLIPDDAAGRLLYAWLAAFNHLDRAALVQALPNREPEAVVDAEMELRRQTGGLALLSAREVEPNLLVFRLRDQTPAAGEVLGALNVVPGSNPAEIASFSLRTVTPETPGGTAARTSPGR